MRRFAALVCHPHPKGGGTMHNKVVYHAMKALNAPEWGLGWPVLRFNFRGTGLSEGRHDGKAETGDVLAASTGLKTNTNGRWSWLDSALARQWRFLPVAARPIGAQTCARWRRSACPPKLRASTIVIPS